ncbi:MAG: hypothetical protein ACK5LG_22215 [Bacteroides thetaiotaomicron]
MAYMKITAYHGLVARNDVMIHPDGYVIDTRGDVVRQAVCPIYDKAQEKLTEGLITGSVYEFAGGLRIEMCTKHQYRNFRESLADFAGYDRVRSPFDGQHAQWFTEGAKKAGSGPFYEFICLPDGMLTIGPVMATKLAADFQAYKKKAKAWDINNQFENGFYEQYLCWYQSFVYAADMGMITIS